RPGAAAAGGARARRAPGAAAVDTGAWTCGARPRRRAAGGGGPVDPRRVPRGGDGGTPRTAQRPGAGAAAALPGSSLSRIRGLGAELPEGVALSILAECHGVVTGASLVPLSDPARARLPISRDRP